ncbi:hypothetical protein AVDCRST_MAG94-446 [uncultured Leptolyngbya sp.]|uniref:Uncharacterized protein n=1 Tax=uncultured Leptolyngbya sp. TaxID=332963 RepID=A0A6J4KCS6_9CYAN|nr:hypothetical protein AVDCRST_MAG94-446 [uncultured Leptolyngbya sp.]
MAKFVLLVLASGVLAHTGNMLMQAIESLRLEQHIRSRTDRSRMDTSMGPASVRAALPTISKPRQHLQRVLLGTPGNFKNVVDGTPQMTSRSLVIG